VPSRVTGFEARGADEARHPFPGDLDPNPFTPDSQATCRSAVRPSHVIELASVSACSTAALSYAARALNGGLKTGKGGLETPKAGKFAQTRYACGRHFLHCHSGNDWVQSSHGSKDRKALQSRIGSLPVSRFAPGGKNRDASTY
jgi:hypothetical protein